MNKFKFKNIKIKNVLFIILFLLFIYLYIITFINTNFKNIIINEIYSKYDKVTFDLKDKVLYGSLNNIVDREDIKTINSTNDKDLIEKIDNIETKKQVSNKKTNKRIIYIYNSHDTEKYSLPYVNDYSITPTVKIASYILKDYLNDLGIDSFVQNKSISSYLNKNKLDYRYCYEASRSYMKEEFKKNKYKIIIDIHRDSIKHSLSMYEYKKKKYAKIMFVVTTNHKKYNSNLKFVNKLNSKINKKYKGLSRGILKRNDYAFNQDLSDHALLIELGGVENTLEEINNTLELLASILSEYIKEEKL